VESLASHASGIADTLPGPIIGESGIARICSPSTAPSTDVAWLTVSPFTGSLDPEASAWATVEVDTSSLPPGPGPFTGHVDVYLKYASRNISGSPAGQDLDGSPTRVTVEVSEPQPYFELSAVPSAQTVTLGGQAVTTTYSVIADFFNGCTGPVEDFSVSGLPSGVTAAFNPDELEDSGESTLLTLTVSPSAPLGTHTLTISAESDDDAGCGDADATAYLTLTSGTFQLAANPQIISVVKPSRGNAWSSTSTVTVQPQGSFSSNVSLTSDATALGSWVKKHNFSDGTLTSSDRVVAWCVGKPIPIAPRSA